MKEDVAKPDLPPRVAFLHTSVLVRHTKLLVAATLAALVVVPAGLAFVAEQAVLNGPRDERVPGVARAKGIENMIWTQSRPGNLNASDAWLRRGSRPKIKLNAKGVGHTGGIDPPWVVYQQIVENSSDIKLYRIDKRKRFDPPKGVNTKAWEWRPLISGKWLVFLRNGVNSATTKLILFNRGNRRSRELARISNPNHDLITGQAHGNWVVWHKCSPVCDTFIYNIGAKKTTKLAEPAGPPALQQYSAGVTRDGVIYTGRSPAGCGVDVEIVRYRRAGDPATGTVIASLPDGIDFLGGFARKTADGSVEFFYSRGSCASEELDIYKITDPAPPPASLGGGVNSDGAD